MNRLRVLGVLVLMFYATACELVSQGQPEMDVIEGPTLCDSDADCNGGVCDPTTGTCVECATDKECPTGKYCDPTALHCVTCYEGTQCATGACDVAAGICKECTTGADCASGQCDVTTGVCLECGANEDCGTDNPCQVGVCVAGHCSYGNLPDGLPCEDGNVCSVGDTCQAGKCSGVVLDSECEPEEQCGILATGEFTPDGTPCDDENPCTLDDYCMNGKCYGDSIAPGCQGEDVDGDGFTIDAGDCNDLNASVFPGAIEVCDGLDNDCNGVLDENCANPCFITGCSGELCSDQDLPSDCMWRDEYKCLSLTVCGPYAPNGSCGWLMTDAYLACLGQPIPCSASAECPEGYTCMEGVCQSPTCYPKQEICDGIDNDCDGLIDESCGGECVISGCNGEVCAPYPIDTDCMWSDEYKCLAYSSCEAHFVNGEVVCGWLETEAYLACLQGTQIPCVTSADCDPGMVCMNGICQYPGYDPCDGIDNDGDGLIDEDCLTCEDGDPCTKDYMDPSGECVSEYMYCDDGNSCTEDYCDPQFGGCVYAQICGYCYYDSQCPPGQVCMNGECTYASNPCQEEGGFCVYGDFVQPKCPNGTVEVGLAGCDLGICCMDIGCIVKTEICDGLDNDCDGMVDEGCYGECDSDDPCSKSYMDETGACIMIQIDCDDNNSCTQDFCDPVIGGCSHISICTDCMTNSDCPEGSVCVEGQCTQEPEPWCWSDTDCAPGQYCSFSGCAVETGLCVSVPYVCSHEWKPVCSCNNKTYINVCALHLAKQSLAYDGACEDGVDMDGDGYTTAQGDCDDLNPHVGPYALEACDYMDNDCDGMVDESCFAACATDSDCKSYEVCMNGMCMALPD